MEILILKSVACLALLMVFYKLFLERLAIHKFKRFYLLGALVISIIIPFITFIKYVEPTFDFGTFDPNLGNTPPYFPAEILIEEPEQTNYLPTILWSIYGLGVLVFASKFCINLFHIVSKINKNEKQKHSNFISVLLNDLIIPHTFFNYIFLNKTKFRAKAIPKEVLLHEQTHASQKHSLDILFIELFQIIFWFNPLLYFIKKDIKLNHEFLADDAVLKQGIEASTYQETLLQFTSNANSMPLAHAINYSLIKKRFTIMKTQTSKKAIWLRSLLLIPLLGGLLFSFSSTKEVEKEVVPAMKVNSSSNIKEYEESTYNYLVELKKYSENGKTSVLRNKVVDAYLVMVEDYSKLSSDEKTKTNKPQALSIEFRDSLPNDLNNKIMNIPGSLLTPLLEVKLNPTIIYLNGSETSLDDLEKNFNKITNNTKSSVHLKCSYTLEKDFVIKLGKKLGGNLENITVAIGETKVIGKLSKEEEKLLDTTLKVNGIICDGCKLNLSKKGVENIILGTTSGDKITTFKIKFPGKPTETIKGDALNGKAQEHLSSSNLGVAVSLFDIKTEKKEKLAPVVITLVDKNDKNYSHSPVVKKGEISQLPPPPPPPTKAPQYVKGKKLTLNEIIKKTPKGVESGFEMLKNGESHYYTVYKGKKTYYNKDGYITNKDGDILPPPPPPPAPPKVKKGEVSNIPPPPPAPPTKKDILNGVSGFSNYILQMENNGDAIFYNNKKTTAKEAISIYKKYGKIDMNTKMIEKGKYQVFLSKSKGENSTLTSEDLTKSRTSNLPPPPPPPMSTIDHVVSMAKKGASFFYDGESISSDKAISIVKNNSKINISSHSDNGKATVHLSTKPITVVNGRAVTKEQRQHIIEQREKVVEGRAAAKEQRQHMLEERKEAMETMKESRKEMLENRKDELEERKKMMKAHRNENRKPLAEQFKGLENKGGEFFYEGDKISEEKAIALIKENPKLNVSMQSNNGKSTVHLSKKGIKVVNGKMVKKEN